MPTTTSRQKLKGLAFCKCEFSTLFFTKYIIIGFLKTFPSRLPFPPPLQAPSFYGVYVPEPDFSLTPLTHLYARATSCCTCPYPPPPFSFHSSYGLFKQELSLSLDTTGLGALAASSMVLVAGGLLATVRAAACRHTRRASMAL